MAWLAGTGHRPDKLGGYSDETFEILVDLAEAALEKYEPELVISGMALGWDLALARAAINLKIPYSAAIPCVGQEKKWPEISQKLYREILSRAAEKIVLAPAYDKGVMQKRNMWMVDQLEDPEDFILALWDGSDGGTKNCIKYAEKKGVVVVNLWAAYQELI